MDRVTGTTPHPYTIDFKNNLYKPGGDMDRFVGPMVRHCPLGMRRTSMLLSIVFECLGMRLFWPEQGWPHAQRMLDYELTQLSEHFTRGAMPLFLLAPFVGRVDGLVRRYIRKLGAGRESGFVYHRAKAALMSITVSPWVIYLALPVSLHPLLILLPSAALLGFATNIAAG